MHTYLLVLIGSLVHTATLCMNCSKTPLVGALSNRWVDSSQAFERSDSPMQKWQDKINSGFDKLVALASDLDKRRKSNENSPHQDGRGGSSPGDRKPLLGNEEAGREKQSPGKHCKRGGIEDSFMRGRSGVIDPPLYSPNSPSLSPLSLPNGRPPTPQSPPAPSMHTPPISSPPPTPSPDHCRGEESPHNHFNPTKGLLDSPPYVHPEIDSGRLVISAPSEQGPLYDHNHHFKKKFYHKDRFSPHRFEEHHNSSHRYSNHKLDYHHHSNHTYGYNNHHSSQGKFRPKGKDWSWRGTSNNNCEGNAGRRSPSHNTSYHNHYAPNSSSSSGGRPPYHSNGPPMRHQNNHHQLLTTAPSPSRQPAHDSHHSLPAGYYSHN